MFHAPGARSQNSVGGKLARGGGGVGGGGGGAVPRKCPNFGLKCIAEGGLSVKLGGTKKMPFEEFAPAQMKIKKSALPTEKDELGAKCELGAASAGPLKISGEGTAKKFWVDALREKT